MHIPLHLTLPILAWVFALTWGNDSHAESLTVSVDGQEVRLLATEANCFLDETNPIDAKYIEVQRKSQAQADTHLIAMFVPCTFREQLRASKRISFQRYGIYSVPNSLFEKIIKRQTLLRLAQGNVGDQNNHEVSSEFIMKTTLVARDDNGLYFVRAKKQASNQLQGTSMILTAVNGKAINLVLTEPYDETFSFRMKTFLPQFATQLISQNPHEPERENIYSPLRLAALLLAPVGILILGAWWAVRRRKRRTQ